MTGGNHHGVTSANKVSWWIHLVVISISSLFHVKDTCHWLLQWLGAELSGDLMLGRFDVKTGRPSALQCSPNLVLLETLLPAVVAPASGLQLCSSPFYSVPPCLAASLPGRAPVLAALLFTASVSFEPPSEYILNLCTTLHRSVLMFTVCLVIIVMLVGTNGSVRWGKWIWIHLYLALVE